MPTATTRPATGDSFTRYGWTVCFWILLIAFQYGYHISALNQIQAVLTCNNRPTDLLPLSFGLPPCIQMSDFAFSLVTAIFTLGGLAGSAIANLVMDSYGRKGALRICAGAIAVGAGLMALSGSILFLALGRFLIGIGSGIGLCVGPIFIAEISPTRISGNVGVLTQLGIVLGIMTTQIIGLRFATQSQWRYVLFFSSSLALGQFFASPFMTESPAWLHSKGREEERKKVASQIWGSGGYEPLLEEGNARDDSPALPDQREKTVKIPQLFKSLEFRRPLLIVCFAMFSQQISGINAVLYYSNDILSKSFPSLGPYLSLGITIVNVLMTFPPIILIERMGRRQLLTVSILGAIFSLLSLGFGLNGGSLTVSSVTILTFIMCVLYI
ncbi:sugar transporter, variant 2 [Coprinopsis cinerea AmutBmut pab1-1]|nr:sugar transporter, variant 2 [Coprinopsis cinerea AmutBmut pab1-1]